jgi:hypothetical protein
VVFGLPVVLQAVAFVVVSVLVCGCAAFTSGFGSSSSAVFSPGKILLCKKVSSVLSIFSPLKFLLLISDFSHRFFQFYTGVFFV